MGMPSITITFAEKAQDAKARMDKGIVGLILKGTVPSDNPIMATSIEDVPSSLSAANREYISQALTGNDYAPKRIVAYCLPASTENYDEAFEYFETHHINYLTVPTAETESATEKIKDWIVKERENGRTIKAVLPNCEADSEAIINFATQEIVCGDKTYTAEQFCPRIAGIIAATETRSSCTFTQIPEVDMVEKLTRQEMDVAIDAGKLILFHDGEKVKIARGVNSLKTTTNAKGEQFKKIKIVEIMDTIKDDITKTIEDTYIGKYPNTYDNKCLLISAIGDYLYSLQQENIIEEWTVEIDIQATKEFLKANGENTSNMDDEEIKTAHTSDKVFLKIVLKMIDVIEEVLIPITV